ncbi:hypothetical protein PsAD2_02085 [Pseudovibrio axinellae]|uniref:N-acetyltransferase domain-containing protein n=1 Tax=Pseudovibrio axinellae TaxID=989403 RepID=A0A165YXY7_9HYPH|nr:GNAT family N-acetyltransferase [Pseudovibrio axinellae]KZL19333.1 hypothetical protein PsAD2_02085 [Pseudovibrio axinellae]SEQ40957.1 Protein N-acetyltransferase, RimJ/RimL family [Pseudovibrio axinellae]
MTTFPRLRTASLTLREWKKTDAPRVLELLQNQNITRMLASAPYPYTKADVEVFLQRFMPGDLSEVLNWAVELQGEVVGSVGAWPLHKAPAMGWWLAEEYWQKGIMYEAVREVLRYLLLDRELPVLDADAFDDNPGSLALIRKLGFQQIGTDTGRSRARPEGEYPLTLFSISPLDFISAQQAKVEAPVQ